MNGRRRVLQIIHALEGCGAAKQLVLLASGLPRDEFEVHVCALTRGGPLLDELNHHCIPVEIIGRRWTWDPGTYLRLQRYIQTLKPELVQTWLSPANAYGRLAAMAAGVRHIVASERSTGREKGWHQWMLDRRLAKHTDAIVVNSPLIRDFFVRHGLPADKFRVIPNAAAEIRETGISRERLLRELDLPPDSRLIAAVGQLLARKHFKDLVWAADLLKVVRDDVHLLIIGDGAMRSRLEAYARAVGITQNVHFLGARQDVPKLLPHCDLLWLASDDDAVSNAVMEAMASGLPVVTTDVPGNRQLVAQGETGYLVAVGDRAGFARYANKILNDPDLARRLGANSRARIAQQYRVETMVERHVALYRELWG